MLEPRPSLLRFFFMSNLRELSKNANGQSWRFYALTSAYDIGAQQQVTVTCLLRPRQRSSETAARPARCRRSRAQERAPLGNAVRIPSRGAPHDPSEDGLPMLPRFRPRAYANFACSVPA